MSLSFERRSMAGTIEFRSEGDKVVATGYAAKWNTYSQNLGGFVERVAPGAFKKTVAEQDVRALYNHDEAHLLARLGAGTLRLEEDNTGLRYEVDLPDTTTGRDVAELLRRGDLFGSSFGFRAIDDEWSETESGFPLRELRQVSLRDVGPVTFPAYTAAEVSLRSLAEQRSLDIHDLVAAAEAGELRSLIVDEVPVASDTKTETKEQEDESRDTPTLRPHILGLYA